MNDKMNMNVALYMRYSSDKQTEQSIEGQERVCTDYCKRQGYKIVAKYIDRATSAFKDAEKRTEFQKMIKDSEKANFEAVVVYKLDRFARNRYDSATYKTKLKRNGVRVISATENISNTPEGIILESVLEGMAEFYSEELSQKVSRGMHETALKCHSCGGSIPLGYKIVDKKYVIDEINAEAVKIIFQLYASNYPLAQIIDTLNEKGFRTTTGKKFVKTSFYNILRNKKYIGVYTYNGIEIEGGVPAIVEKDLFDKVQTKLSMNKKAPAKGKAKLDYMLSQKLFCGHCGQLMTGKSGTGKSGKTYYYYGCNNKGCDKKTMRKELIENLVFNDALKFIKDENIEKLADMAVKESKREIDENSLIPELTSKLSEIDTAVNNLLKYLEKGIASDSIDNRIKELEEQKNGIKKSIREEESKVVRLEKDQVIFWLKHFTKGDPDDPIFKRHILDLLVNSVTITDTKKGYKLEIAYNLIDNSIEPLKSSSIVSLGGTVRTFTNPIFYYCGIISKTSYLYT